ncbi:hypothetical protein LPTSP4_02310 [Leptospira ryugenii]|uniref:Uncharacterized protein n=1 Tax=Leptospira ryugenii TaxID=1917863 RepID=A0A2P2DVR5_9LEPT|nr:hypothetical protein [Leptospira ryugenii]GBF48731.1 hypothetical protein LPTSP4_02310 [Leptospira ryugenii]
MKYFTLLLFLLLLHCESSPDTDVNFIGKDGSKYSSAKDPNAILLLKGISSNSSLYTSFRGEFTMKIQVLVPKKETFLVDGKIFFSKEKGLLKIQLMDTFFGLIFSELIASPTEISIKPSGSNKAFNQPMGDIVIQDPNTKKNIQLPFPVIYQYLSGTFQNEITSPKARFMAKEGRILLEKKDGIYEYFFEESLPIRIELSSPARGLKAVSIVQEKDRVNAHPAKAVLSKVISLSDDKENALILLTMKKINKTEVPINTFTF